jgi:serine/threonine protein kinase
MPDSSHTQRTRLEWPVLDQNIKRFAVKIVRDNDEEKLRAHENEFYILSRLNHKNIVRAVEIFKDPFKSEVFQVMEYVEGREILD